jgi:hypothetical protein
MATAENLELPEYTPEFAPCSPPLEEQPDKRPESLRPGTNGSKPGSNSVQVMKIYKDKSLYSIFDHTKKEYIYKKSQDGDKGFTLTYSGNICTAIHDSDGKAVYPQEKKE